MQRDVDDGVERPRRAAAPLPHAVPAAAAAAAAVRCRATNRSARRNDGRLHTRTHTGGAPVRIAVGNERRIVGKHAHARLEHDAARRCAAPGRAPAFTRNRPARRRRPTHARVRRHSSLTITLARGAGASFHDGAEPRRVATADSCSATARAAPRRHVAERARRSLAAPARACRRRPTRIRRHRRRRRRPSSSMPSTHSLMLRAPTSRSRLRRA